jgi:branched-chain amino acid transport system substrate-binding protein
MRISRRGVLAGATSVGFATRGWAQERPIRVGVLSDMSGPYHDTGGPTVVASAQQAVEDSGLPARGIAVEIVSADHQNKADIGMSIARQWFDRDGVDAVLDVNNSSIALAINGLVAEKNKVQLCTGAASTDLTGSGCSPNMVHWLNDTWCDAHATGSAVMRTGGDKWFFVVADYTFGHLIQQQTAQVVEAAGGKVMGTASYPFPATTDFSSFLVAAQASGANVVAFCNAAGDLVNCVKQSHEFGLAAAGIKLVGMVTYITDIHTLGAETAQGLLLNEPFYWDLNDRTRSFANRIKPKTPNNMPNGEHACAYGATLHYLKAVAELGAARAKASGRDAVDTMKRMPTDDDCFGAGSVRADGRVLHPVYLFQVKKPAESHGPWDLYNVIGTVPPEQAFRPLKDGGCKFIQS